MMNMLKRLGGALAVIGVVAVAAMGPAQAACKKVRGHVTSDLVAVFSNGEACPSPLGLCTEGRYSGRLKGRFTFVAETLVPYAAQDPAAPADVAATTGVVRLNSKFCGGTLVLTDTSAFSVGEDGLFGGVETVDGEASTGGCSGASGRIHLAGVFQAGCVDCSYEGEVCRLGKPGHDDDD